MSSKHPGRQTEFAKFTSVMRKLQNRLDAEKAERVKNTKSSK